MKYNKVPQTNFNIQGEIQMKTIIIEDLKTLSVEDLERVLIASEAAYRANPYTGMKVILTEEDVFTAASTDYSGVTSPLQWKVEIHNIIKKMSREALGFNRNLVALHKQQ
jgi:hypothetical protein